MRHLKVVLSEFCGERLKFFKFVTGLAAIPATCDRARQGRFSSRRRQGNGDQPPAAGDGDALRPAPLSAVQNKDMATSGREVIETEGADQGKPHGRR